MNCKECGQDTTSKKLKSDRGSFKIPFKCNSCNLIKIDYIPVRDVMIVWKYPAPDQVGGIHLVDDKFIGGSTKEALRPEMAVVLAMGKGYFHPKRKTYISVVGDFEVGDVVYFNKKVPWNIELKNSDGNLFEVTFCGFSDAWGVDQQDF